MEIAGNVSLKYFYNQSSNLFLLNDLLFNKTIYVCLKFYLHFPILILYKLKIIKLILMISGILGPYQDYIQHRVRKL